jgi:hypothetical protein
LNQGERHEEVLSGRPQALGAALLLEPAVALAQADPATAMDGRWHFRVAPYLWASGLEGTAGLNGIVSVPVDLSFGDALDKLDFAFLGFVEGRKDRFGFGLNIAYMNLGADVTGPVAGKVGLGADVRTVTLEALVTYRVVNDEARGGLLNVLAGVRYFGNRAELTVDRNGDAIAGTEKSLDWADALAGVRFRLPLGGGKASLDGRADIGGLGSDFTWNLQGGLDVKLGRTWTVDAGYRYMDVDYDKGQGLERRIWKIKYQGPYLAFSKAW